MDHGTNEGFSVLYNVLSYEFIRYMIQYQIHVQMRSVISHMFSPKSPIKPSPISGPNHDGSVEESVPAMEVGSASCASVTVHG